MDTPEQIRVASALSTAQLEFDTSLERMRAENEEQIKAATKEFELKKEKIVQVFI